MRRLLVLALALVVTPTASAATLALSLTTSATVTVAAVTLSGIDQTKTFTIGVSEAYTGFANNAGWNVTAASTTLTSGAKTLPAITVTTVSRGSCTGTGCVNPTNSITWPVTLSTTASKIYNAAAATGLGTVTLTGTYQVSYPANALPGAYTATVTVATSTGP